MKLYAHNLEIRIKQKPVVRNKTRYKTVVSKISDSIFDDEYSILIVHQSNADILNFLTKVIDSKKISVHKRITFSVKNERSFKKQLFDSFKEVPAAGGIVEKNDKILVIKRKGLWDLPKGKIEKGESIEDAAEREVQEECGVAVSLKEKIGKTLHLYKMKGKYSYKYTHWYRMVLLSDKNMAPQKEEGIEEVKWFSVNESIAMETFSSITGILEKYYRS
jgi:8-oxo-dGTP pyrophosphatase MutT (NUDIX family)